MNRSGSRAFFLILAVLFLALSAFAFYTGYDKLTNYYNSDNFTSLNKNAYVGGDAYNYIINGNYATGFFVLSMGLLTCSVLCLGTRAIIGAIPEGIGNKEKETLAYDLPDL